MTTAGLVDIEWIIEDIAGDGVIDNPQASLVFGIDGRLSGSATCNRIFGRYQLQGKQLSIEPMGTTMMACPEAVDNQERKLLKLLPSIMTFDIDATGALILRTDAGQTIVARH